MRDHPLRDGEILAGLFGGVKGCLGGGVKMEDLLVEYYSNPSKQQDDFWSDQRFLAEVVFPRIRGSFLVHDDYLNEHSTCKKTMAIATDFLSWMCRLFLIGVIKKRWIVRASLVASTIMEVTQ